MSAPSDAVISPGSTILVTGANGYIGSHVVDQLLQIGYRVRGTVRDAQKSAWLTELFEKTYGKGKFELVELEDITKKENLTGPMKGCAGIIHVASDVSFGPDPNVVIPVALALTTAALEAAEAEPSVKRFVQTSSSSAAAMGRANEKFDLTAETWNDKAVEEAWKPPPYAPDRAIWTYSASKTQQEQEIWKFVKEKKPHFVVNSVLPDYNVGKILNVEKQGYPSSVSLLKMVFEGYTDFAYMLQPQHEIDVQDCARLHVAALLHPDVQNERIFGYAYPKNWTNTIEILRKLYPERTFPDPPQNEGEDRANVVGKPRAESLLKWLGRDGWTSYETSIKLVTDTLV